MKRFHLYIIIGAFATLMGGCMNPDYVSPTATRQGITSLSAYFTSGTYKDKAAATYSIANDSILTDYVIPVPWYYPEESNNTTESYMSAMKVVAGIANNCIIDPAIAMLDLTKKNYFTFTNPDGSTRQISISGQRVHSSSCAIKSFIIDISGLTGVIDENAKTISLISADDLSACTVDVSLSAHATISPDPTVAHNFNSDFQFTVTADNGTTTAVYTVKKQIPPKIPNGIRRNSQVNLFTNSLSYLGITSVDHPTLASIGNNVIIDAGDGSTPIYISKATGKLGGQIAIGNADPKGAVCSDVNGNMLICNYAASGSQFKIYKTNSVTTAPTLYLTYDNALGLALGSRMHIQGSLDSNAIITATCDGPYSQHFVRWIITNGVVGAPELIKVGVTDQWGGLSGNAKVVARSSSVADGYFLGYYDDGKDNVYYCDGTSNNPTTNLSGKSDNSASNSNYNCLDTREFNNMKYMVLLTVSYFSWSDSELYMYDVSSLSNFTGAIDKSPALVYYKDISLTNAGGGIGDVLMIPSKDGYKLDIYYVDNNNSSIGAVEFDCIDK
jgi:hypothetical protein